MRFFNLIWAAVILLACLPQTGITEENTDRKEILSVVQKFFDSMTARDQAAAREILQEDGQYYGILEKQGVPSIKRRTHAEYVESLPASEDVYVERMWEPTVMIHGPIAVVWTPYDFHVNGELKHCGVDAFTLIKTTEGWKIAGTVYTIEPEGCGDSSLEPLGLGMRQEVTPGDIEKAKAALKPFKKQLMKALTSAMPDGLDKAIKVCQAEAPRIAREVAAEGVEMGRTSHRLRNPDNKPRAWMKPLLEAYAANPGGPEPRAVTLGGSRFGYVEPIYMKSVCAKCHGVSIDPAVREALNKAYPDDKATGFKNKEFRGMFWVTMERGHE